MKTGTIHLANPDYQPVLAENLLKKLGVEVVGFVAEDVAWNVRVSDEAMKKLDPFWGSFWWALAEEPS